MKPMFFAGPGKSMRDLSLSEDALVATNPALLKSLELTSGGRTEIRDEYDCYLLHGLELTIAIPLLILRKLRTERATPRWPAPAPAPAPGAQEAFRAMVAAAIRETIAVKILTMLRQITSAPIFVSPGPVSHLQLSKLREWLVERQAAASLTSLFEILCAETAAALDARFLPQPAITREADGMATQQIYSQRPARFGVKEPAEDKSHMDAEYGAAVLRDFLAAAPFSRR
jgi:hypothetical protein